MYPPDHYTNNASENKLLQIKLRCQINSKQIML